MAVIWEVKINLINIAEKRASVSATRTDDVSGEADTYTISHAIIGTAQQKTDLLNNIWAHHLANIAKKAQIKTVLGGLELAAKTNLEARE